MDYITAERMNSLPFSGIRAVMEKANQMQKNGDKIIHMELGRPDFDTPEKVKQAAAESLAAGHVFYTSNYGTPALREAIAEKLRTENNIDCEAAEVLVTIGVSEATYSVMAAFLQEGDEVLVPDPVWLNYIHVPTSLGAKAVTYSLKEENDYQIDAKELEEKITERTKMIVLISPHNPTGSVLEREALDAIARIAIEHDLLVLSDEIYEKLVYDDFKFTSIASLPGMKERTITLGGFSKAYSMTGWRLGYMAAPKEIISACVRVHQYATTCAASFAQDAAVVAIKDCEEDVQIMRREYERRRNYCMEALNSIDGISCNHPKGAFYIFVNIKSLNMPSMEVAEYILEKEKIALVPGSTFGPGGEGYLRISYACGMDDLVLACEGIKRAVEALKNRA